MQVTEIYKARVKLFKHLHKSRQGDRLSLIVQNGVSTGKSKKLNCYGVLFCDFIHDFWSRHMKWLHCIDKIANIFGHSSPIMIIRLMLVLDYLQ